MIVRPCRQRAIDRLIPIRYLQMSWSPQIWFGCDAFAWARLLIRHRFAVPVSRWPIAAAISVVCWFHTLGRFVQWAIYGRRIARTPINHAPVFILGHWRSGTTWLHELLASDPRHAAPTTYDVFLPHHFLISRAWLPRLIRNLIPSRRLMDNMAAGWDRPQEEEFALCLLGLPSPYEQIAFPNQPPNSDSFDLRNLPSRTLRRWKLTYQRFVQALTLLHRGRRLVLKSPPHTARIETLLEMFPDARFVHIIRDPFVLYPSTLRLWRFLSEAHGLQRPSWIGLSERTVETLRQMYEFFESGRRGIPSGRLYELRYEDLVRDPISQLQSLYSMLDLGDFEPCRSHVESCLASVRGYETNRYSLTDAERRLIADRWRDVIQRYGYAPPDAVSS